MMARSTFSSACWTTLIVAAIAGALTVMLPRAAHASIDGQTEGSVPVHYVRLTGYGGDNDVNRKNLITDQHACVRVLAAFGRSAKALAPNEVPAVIAVVETEIYYAANRTLTINQGILHAIDDDTCALIEIPHRIAKLASSIGRCDIDLIKKVARGQCDAAQHEQAIAHTTRVRPPKVDLDKVPLAMRAQVKAHIERLQQLGQATPEMPEAAASEAERKVVAGMPCEVHRNDAVNVALCIASRPASGTRPLVPYPIPIAPYNGGNPGILLETRSPAITQQAQQVRLNISVPRALFMIPADVTIKTIPEGRR